MNTLAARLVADELADAQQALTRAADGPSAEDEDEARDRLTRAVEAATAILTALPAAGLGTPNLQPGDPVLWLNTFGEDLGILRGQVTSAAPEEPGDRAEWIELRVEAAYGAVVYMRVRTDYVIPAQ